MIHSILTLSTCGTMINPRYFDDLTFFTRFGLSEHFDRLLNLPHKHILHKNKFYLMSNLIISGNCYII